MDEFLRLHSNQKDTALHGVNESQSEVLPTMWVSLTLSDLQTLRKATFAINALKTH